MPIRKSSVGGTTPSGTTADRPANPSVGDTFFNGTLGVQEIYTSSGWLPATGANDFNVVLNGEDTSVTLDKEYFSGAYTITSALSDTSFDIYLFNTQGNAAGYTNSPSINATSNFNKIVVLGGQAGDLLSFSYKTTFTTASITDEVAAGPIIKSISIADLPNIDDTTVITGINFAEDIQVTFTGTDSVALSAKSVIRSSATSLLVTRPDNLIEDYSPYTVTVTNPGITAPSGTSGHISTNAITAGGDPVWSTPSGSLTQGQAGTAYSFTLEATDPDGGNISYSIVTGQLTTGLSLNSSTGEISGTPTAASTNFTIAAVDSGGNITNRAFNIPITTASGGTLSSDGSYIYHTFTSNGTFSNYAALTADVLVVAGGGGAGGSSADGWNAGGGGAGGFIESFNTSIPVGQYSVTIGAGGAAGIPSAQNNGSGATAGDNGEDSSLGSLITATGGGGGGASNGNGGSGDKVNGKNGGSGGGGGSSVAAGGSGGTGIPGQGNNGGAGKTGGTGHAGQGGGASGAGGQQSVNSAQAGGAGTDSSIDSASIVYAIGGGTRYSSPVQDSAANTGRGGNASYAPVGTAVYGGAGGSGIVIIRYPI